MLSIVGIVAVLGAIIGGYLMERGKLLVLMQPAEVIIIGGAAIGTLLIANPLPVVIGIAKGLRSVFVPSRYKKSLYLATMVMLNDLFNKARKGGLASLEPDVEQPQQSELFKKYPTISAEQHAIEFICDTLRIMMAGNISPHELDQMLEIDLEVHHKETTQFASALVTVADALPGLGIVAAVLGVIVTMSALGGPPSEIGHKVAAALVGTFLGILLCYGFFSPFAASMTKAAEGEAQYYNCLRVGLLAYSRGAPPLVAVEFVRRSIPYAVRPTFLELETELRGKPAEQPIAA